MPRKRKRSPKSTISAAERLFNATFGRAMTTEERKTFIFEKPATLKEIAEREQRLQSYRFLRQT